MKNKLKFTVKCLLENKLRFVLTVLSITIGVVSILIVNSISSFGVQAVSQELDSLGMSGLNLGIKSDSVILSEIELSEVGKINGVEKCAPANVNTAAVVSPHSDEETTAVIWGIDERMPEVISFDLLYGRFINKQDLKDKSRVCILDESMAEELFGSENIVGRTVQISRNSSPEDFEIIGVVKTGGGIMQSMMGSFFPAFLYIPYSSIDSSPSYNQVFIQLDGTRSSDETAAAVERTLNSDADSEEYVVTDTAGHKGTLDNMLNIVTGLLTVIGAISLIVSSISIMNIMLISVNERIKEIGIKKSIGATSADILLDFLTESVIISVIGAAFGTLLTCILIKSADLILGIGINVNWKAAAATMFISVTLGIIFGIFPAYKASKFRPVEALRR